MRITVNLSPADMRSGTSFDLPVAIGILQSLGHLKEEQTADIMFAGELSLMEESMLFVVFCLWFDRRKRKE